MSGTCKAELERLFGKTDSCPSLEKLIEREQIGIADSHMSSHVNGCLFCKTELASWRAFEHSQPSAEEASIVDQIGGELDWRVQSVIRREIQQSPPTRASLAELLGGWFRSKQKSALSLVFVCSALVLISVQIQFRPAAPPISPAGTHQNWRGENLSVVAPRGSLDSVPNAFTWKGIPNASQYEVRLLGVDGAELWKIRTESTNLVIGPDLKSLLARHSVFFWRVTGLSSQGRELASSEIEKVEVRH